MLMAGWNLSLMTVIQEILDFGFIDLEASKRNSAHVFSGSFPTLIKKEGEHGDQRWLDFVFASKNLVINVNSARIIANDSTNILSDHLPVVVDWDPVR
jgi:endonuclease/exonuclease/phosphatase family metal-dependent hydrolase